MGLMLRLTQIGIHSVSIHAIERAVLKRYINGVVSIAVIESDDQGLRFQSWETIGTLFPDHAMAFQKVRIGSYRVADCILQCLGLRATSDLSLVRGFYCKAESGGRTTSSFMSFS